MAYNKIDQDRELMRAVAGWRTERWAELAPPTPRKRTLTEALAYDSFAARTCRARRTDLVHRFQRGRNTSAPRS